MPIDHTVFRERDKKPLCPKRLVNGVFDECYQEKCEWWVPEEKDRAFGGMRPGHCAVRFLGEKCRDWGIKFD